MLKVINKQLIYKSITINEDGDFVMDITIFYRYNFWRVEKIKVTQVLSKEYTATDTMKAVSNIITELNKITK